MSYAYSTSIIDDIKAQIGIEETFALCFPGRPLTRRGQRLWTLCPFHQEKTTSFCLFPQMQRFNCYGCHAHGDVIDLYAMANKLNTREAIKQLAIELGIARDNSPEAIRAAKAAKTRRERAAAINRDLEQTIRAARLDCCSMERWLYLLKKHIYQERDLGRPCPVFALQNLSYIEHLSDLFLGSAQDQAEAAIAYRRWEAWQHANGIRL